MATPEIAGIHIVLNGSFNPAVFHPRWLADHSLLSPEAADYAIEGGLERQFIVSPPITVFVADWLTVNVRQEQLTVTTADEAREPDLKTFASGLMMLLPETPIDAMGMNYSAHFRAQTADSWNDFGDKFLPKELWEGVIPEGPWVKRPDGQRVGLRSMMVEVARDETRPGGILRIEVGPSVHVLPYGVYVSLNDHFQVAKAEGIRGSAGEYGQILDQQWSKVRETQSEIVDRMIGHL
jgi:hypothetical protein